MRYRLACRTRSIRLRVSRRVNRVLDLLDMAHMTGDTLDELEKKNYTRAAVIVSRQARLALRYPKHSKANEILACDWIDKHLPEGVTPAMRHRMVPLAIKLTFVRSREEEEAKQLFDFLTPCVDSA